jgi:uncharacterized LabA/DUF88 family protein
MLRSHHEAVKLYYANAAELAVVFQKDGDLSPAALREAKTGFRDVATLIVRPVDLGSPFFHC